MKSRFHFRRGTAEMLRQILVIMTVITTITNSAVGSPDDRDDPYKPVIRLLKEIRKEQRRQHHSGFTNIRDQYDRQGSQFQFASASGGNGGGGSTPYPILTPGNGGGGSSSGFGGSGISSILPSAGGSSSNYPPILPNIPSGSELAGQLGLNRPQLPPYPIEQVNRGVSTIINGVRSFDLAQILRGAFVFPRNENVRSVANNVIDSIFGAVKQPSG